MDNYQKFLAKTSNEHAVKMAAYTVQQELGRAYNESIVPQFNRFNNVIKALEQHLVKNTYKDFDAVTKPAIEELFVLNPKGEVVGVKNPALLRYIQESPMPSFALYDYALSRRAPQAIAEARTTRTKELLENLNRKPKGPTVPPGSSAGGAAPTELDWETPPDIAEEMLAKRGLI